MTTTHSTSPETEEFEQVLRDEQEWIARRRSNTVEDNIEIPDREYAGLALSGGGIRSAVFNLGLLQALENHGFIKNFDYMSTVSGGGYIGSCLTWLKSIRPTMAPFGTTREDYSGTAGVILSWLRSHGKYLTAGDGLSAWSLIAALLTGTLINLLVVVPPLFLVIFALTRDLPFVPPNLFHIDWLNSVMHGSNDGFALLALAGIVAIAVFFTVTVVYVLSTGISRLRNHRWQRSIRVWQGKLLMYGSFFMVIGTVPIVHGLALKLELYILSKVENETSPWATIFDESAAGLTFLTGLLTMILSKPRQSKEETASNVRKLIFSFGLILLIYGLFLMGFDLMKDLSDPNTTVGGSILDYDESLVWSPWYQAALASSIFLAIVINVNDVSMHRYYRNRLMEAFMPLVGKGDGNDDLPEPDSFLVYRSTPVSDAPYHIINASVNMVGSENIKLQGRGADNFILSPLYCGSPTCGYAHTGTYMGGQMDLATAFSISGAAIDPNSYATRSRAVSFLMSLLNIRLGYWIRNPRFPAKFLPGLSRPRWYVYLLREMLGSGLNENVNHVHLSDGGHFENLGLYELIRRRCRYIIVSDVGADPEYAFQALAKVIEMARVDFGTRISLRVKELEPQGEEQFSAKSFVIGSIDYPEKGVHGQIIYVKPVVTSDMPEDIHGYRRNCPVFPNESTANQFFNESQFEAYRELGFQIGRQLCISGKKPGFTGLFDDS
jgi:predicted acylesterase/phospholipase RssA